MIRQPTVPTSASAFEIELAGLVAQARHERTDIRGAYDVRTPNPDEPDYTIEISEIVKKSDR